MAKFQYFAPSELECRCGCGLGEDDMDALFMRRIVELRKKCDFPFVVTSAVRCPEHNQKVSSTGLQGPHVSGHAIDVALYGERAFKVMGLASQYGMTGVGVHQTGPRGQRFLHLDDLPNAQGQPREWAWSY